MSILHENKEEPVYRVHIFATVYDLKWWMVLKYRQVTVVPFTVNEPVVLEDSWSQITCFIIQCPV